MPKTYYIGVLAALKCDSKNALKVTDKGLGLTAEHILQFAERHKIPLQAEPELFFKQQNT